MVITNICGLLKIIFTIISENLAVITSDLRLSYWPYFMAILSDLKDLEFFLVKS